VVVFLATLYSGYHTNTNKQTNSDRLLLHVAQPEKLETHELTVYHYITLHYIEVI